jgi:hypothetical protein
LIASGLAAENAALAGESANGQTMTAAAAKAYKYLLVSLQAVTIGDPAAPSAALEASQPMLREAQSTFEALSAAAIHAVHREPRPQGPPIGR